MTVHLEHTLGDIAARNPSATRVFLRHKLDFCCGGQRTLKSACEKANLDPGAIAQEIHDESTTKSQPEGWAERPLQELVDHIESRYHATLRKDVPPLIEAARRVERVHAKKEAVPAGLAEHLERVWTELQAHMHKEEAVLFPLIRRGGRGEAVYMPIRVMEGEHDSHGHDLAKIRALTGDLEIPGHACATWTALYEGLRQLEEELMEHIHLENNILFARAARGT